MPPPAGEGFLNVYFQFYCFSFLSHTLKVMLSTFGCVNWYASIHFAMSFSGIV